MLPELWRERIGGVSSGVPRGGGIGVPGTGTTGIAARRFTGIDLNSAFAALAAERLRHAAPAAQAGTGNGSEDTSQ
jgi:hypothetical protein